MCYCLYFIMFHLFLLSIFKLCDISLEFSGKLKHMDKDRNHEQRNVDAQWLWSDLEIVHIHPKQSHMVSSKDILQKPWLPSANQPYVCFDADMNFLNFLSSVLKTSKDISKMCGLGSNMCFLCSFLYPGKFTVCDYTRNDITQSPQTFLKH